MNINGTLILILQISLKMKEEVSGDVSTKEAKGFIQPVQELIFLNRMIRFYLSAHIHPKQAKIMQGDLHIFPPIKIVEGYKDPGYKSSRIHHFFLLNRQLFN